MTLSELIVAARVSFLEDNVSPQLWSDLELKRYANEAEVEACRRSELLFDSTTPDVCQIAVVADVATYPLHSKIRRIVSAILGSSDYVLRQFARHQMDRQTGPLLNWRFSSGQPSGYLVDVTSIRFFPTPVSADTVSLEVVRFPLHDMVNVNDTPEIPESYHYGLVKWMCHLAYSKSDSDGFNAGLSQMYEARFAQEFGLRMSALMEKSIKTLPLGNMRMTSRGYGL
ncbi:DUF6682 family protein [Candidatus Magnetobacterium casense]|uniref:Uncharacterized protein n=1 Tax=Candidatus Magnetobacterium casense TaxID=1455061 RepID=A0ABS6S259_9BACT|nr:DUF6682 family protein [Candidatus Magnetobacterium casensis]MBV6342489.1 hypothetical protein [Candidatus Magnetobacterium casensis]